MALIVTSNFPADAAPRLVERLQAVAAAPRIAWIAPQTEGGRANYEQAVASFSHLGFTQLEYCDIDREKDDVQLAFLHEFDIIYLSGGDPIAFRYHLLRAGLGGRLRQALAAGCVIVTASGGSLLLTPNVSVHRLRSESLGAVLATRARYDALSLVEYELLPHLNCCDEALIGSVQRYAATTAQEVIGLPDGSALLHETPAAGFDAIGENRRFK